MIVFDLKCICGFTFEGWFQDRNDFENQLNASYLVCPKCSSREVHKILSPIRFRAGSSNGYTQQQSNPESSVSLEDAEKAIATLQKFVEENFEDVGADLAQESLKIHYGVGQPRNIRGVTTEAEERKLQEEGIRLLKIPMPAKRQKEN